MIKHDKYESCDLFLENKQEKLNKEYFNEYGYNFSENKKKSEDHFKTYAFTNQNNVKTKPKR